MSLPQGLCTTVWPGGLFPQFFPQLAPSPPPGLSSNVTCSERPSLTCQSSLTPLFQCHPKRFIFFTNHHLNVECVYVCLLSLSPGSQLHQGRSSFVDSSPCLVPVNLCRRDSSVGFCLHVSTTTIYMKIPHGTMGPPSKRVWSRCQHRFTVSGDKASILAESRGGSWE